MTKRKGIDWTKKDIYEGIGRPDLKPKPNQFAEGKWEAELAWVCDCLEQNCPRRQALRTLLEATRREGFTAGEKAQKRRLKKEIQKKIDSLKELEDGDEYTCEYLLEQQVLEDVLKLFE